MLSEPSYQCPTCGSTDGCLCRLLTVQPTTDTVKDTMRDFEELAVGTRVRRPKGTVELCPLCDKPGVHIVVPRWRYRLAREQWIHSATVSAVGYCDTVACQREVAPKTKKRGQK